MTAPMPSGDVPSQTAPPKPKVELAQLSQRQLLALACRVDLLTFCRVVYPSFDAPPHITLIASALSQVARYIESCGMDGIGRLRIELPPRHGKSQLVARLFSAWMMGRNPDLRIILASHGAQLSEGHSRYVRNTIRSNAFASIFPRVQLAADSQARESWDLAEPYQGGMLAVGTGGSVTGRGAGLIIADDLIKSREEYESQSQRDKLWAWWTDDLSTRKEPHAAVVSIGTRWGVDDILGRLEVNEADKWHVIRLPALALENDPLGRSFGAALWPDRFNEAALNEQRESMGEYSFAALYQQNPVAAAGGIFQRDNFKYCENVPSNITRLVRFWDLALSTKSSADYTVGTLIGETDGRYYILDVVRGRWQWADAITRIVETALSDGNKVQIGIEQVLFSVAAVVELLKHPSLHNFSIRGYTVDKDKVTRALPFAARVDAGLVSVLRSSWTYNFIDELCAFPAGKHDDQVDSAAGAYASLEMQSAVYSADVSAAATQTAPYWAMADNGQENALYSRAVIFGAIENGAICVIDEYFAPMGETIADTIKACRNRHSDPNLCFVPSEAPALTFHLMNEGVFFTQSKIDLDEAAKLSADMVKNGLLHISARCERTLSELNAYSSTTERGAGAMAALHLVWRNRYAVDYQKVG